MKPLWVKSAKLLQGCGAQLAVMAFGEDKLSIHTVGNSMPSLSPLQLDPRRPGGTEKRAESERARKGESEGAAGIVLSGRGKYKRKKYLS